ncbi:helix-turn-helix domain-containing protein [Pontibacter litorisediminis]|uniref:helix-turn-helix domain-containing protein n=1 Tax=Pontibacter litorisediminis TaxID=1846260 RepID=UPI0023EB670D|nr:helix-turn-helix domain-containing protein [Pontibacter litorisediminis]
MENPFETLYSSQQRMEGILEEIFRAIHNVTCVASQASSEKPMSAQEAAAYLDISMSTLYKRVSNREVPCRKKGSKLYFDRGELTKWVEAGRKKTQDEVKDSIYSK